jgi:hypothetical protein
LLVVFIVLLSLFKQYRDTFEQALKTGLRFLGGVGLGVAVFLRSAGPSTTSTVIRPSLALPPRPPPFALTVALNFLLAIALGVSALLIALFTDPHNTRITDIFNALMFAFATSLGSLIGLVGGHTLR